MAINKRRWALTTATAAAAAFSLILTACAGGTDAPAASDGKPVTGGNLTVQIPQDPGSLDAAFTGNVSTVIISNHIFQRLVAPNENYEPTPVLAESYERSEDGLSWTFVLRDGITFSDGTPMTSKDVAASLDHWVKQSSYADAIAKVVTSVEATDERTTVIHLSSAFPVDKFMAGTSSSAIVKAETAEKAGEQGFGRDEVIGSGPYKLKSWDTEEVILERNDKYQAPEGEASGYAGAQKAYLDSISFKVVADADSVINGLKTGLWDVAQPTEDNYALLKKESSLEVVPRTDGVINAIYTNSNPDSIMSDARARDAFNMAIDKKAMAETVGGDPALWTLSGAFSMKGSALFSEAGEDEYKKHDPEKAKALFKEAGLKEGDVIKFVTTGEFPQFKEWAVLAQDQLKQIGIESTIESYDFGTMLAKMKEPGTWDLNPLFDVGLPSVPEFSSQVVGMGAANYSNPVMDQLNLDFNAAATPDEMTKALNAIQALAWVDKTGIVLYQSSPIAAFNKKVHGYDGFEMFFASTWVGK